MGDCLPLMLRLYNWRCATYG